MANYIARPKNLVASSVMTAIKEAYGYNDEDFYNHFSMPTAMIHFHGGDNPEIAWNDVQAIQSINKYNENIKRYQFHLILLRATINIVIRVNMMVV